MSKPQPPTNDHPDGMEEGDPPAPPAEPGRREVLRNLATGVAGLGLGLSASSAFAAPDKSAKVYGPNCTASGATSSANLGVRATILVRAYNVANQPLAFGGDKFQDHLVGPAQAPTDWTDNGNGTYTLGYTLPAAGQYTLRIKHHGSDIVGSPFTIATVPVASGRSVATGALVTEGTVNTPFGIAIQAKDASGNNLTAGGATVDVSVASGPAGFTPFTVFVTDHGDGTYAGQTSGITATGIYSTVVRVNGTPITGSPFTFYSFLASPRSTVSAPAAAVAGQTVTVTIQGVTLAGTNVTTGQGADLFSVIVNGPGNTPALVTGVDNQDGTYAYWFVAESAGSYTVSASIHGQPLVGTGATIAVSPAGTRVLTPSLCTADGAGIASANQNYFAHFVVTTVDQNGSVFYVASAAVTATATTATTSWPVTVVDNGNGTYSCKYLPTTAEPVAVAIAVNGTPIASSPFVGVAVRTSCHAPYCSLQSSTTEPVGPIVWTFTMLDENAQPVLDFHDNFVLVLTNGYPLSAPIFQQQFPGVGQLAFYAPVFGTMEFRVDIVNDVNELTMAGTPSFTIFS